MDQVNQNWSVSQFRKIQIEIYFNNFYESLVADDARKVIIKTK